MAHPRLWVRVRTLVLAVALAVPGLVVNVSPTLAAPNYEHPFWCGRTYDGTTYPGHGWGLDINADGDLDDGDEVMATASGTVVDVIVGNGEVWIDHGSGYQTVYAHLREIQVQETEQVTTGQLLGYADNVGQSTGPHLHYGQFFNGQEQQVRFYGQPYPYQWNVQNTGPDFTSQHCIPATATDLAGAGFRVAIDWMYAFDYALGCSPTQFCPTVALEREEMASFLARTLRLPDTANDYFTDDETSTHEADINKIAAAGITLGCASGRFCPTGIVDRAMFAVFLGRGLEWTDVQVLATNPPDYFTDDENTGSAELWINRLAHAGVTNGCGSTTYCPTSPTLREMAAGFFFRAQDLRPWPPGA